MNITGSLLKKTALGIAGSVLEGASYVFDKGAELTDEAHEWVQELGREEKDRSAREKRQEKRTSKNSDESEQEVQ